MNVRPGLLIALGLVVLLYVFSRTSTGKGVIEAVTARGLRNNNPGNIRRNAANDWVGQVKPGADPEFVEFSEPRYGVRAIGKILQSYDRQGLRTVAGIIGRWAPATENNTSSYVGHVASELKVAPDDPIDVRTYLPRLTAAIIKHENGVNPYSLGDISKWVNS